MSGNSDCNKSQILLGIILSLGLISAAFILGYQFKNLRAQGAIEVKGLAEEKVTADLVEWTVGLSSRGGDYGTALKNLKANRPQLDRFLQEQKFKETELKIGIEKVEPFFREGTDANGRYFSRQEGFKAIQDVVITSTDLDKVEKTRQAILNFKSTNDAVTFSEPQYLIANLESLKHSLIAKATQDAYRRAVEFSKTGGVKVGGMRKASQGTFNIMSDNVAAQGNDSWGGIYDKSTKGKQVRLVVTIEYGIDS